MNVITLLLLAIIAGFAVMGFRVGLVRRVVEFLGLIASFILAMRLAPTLVEIFGGEVDVEETVALYTAWVAVFIAGLVATRFIAWGLRKVIRISILGWVDRLGGTVFGFLLGLVLASVILHVMTRIPGAEAVSEQAREHPVARVIYQAAPMIYTGFRSMGGDEEDIWEKIQEQVDQHTSASVLRTGASA